MKRRIKEIALQTALPSKWPATLFGLAVVPCRVALSATALADGSDGDARDRAHQYQQVNLVSNQCGKAMLQEVGRGDLCAALAIAPREPFYHILQFSEA